MALAVAVSRASAEAINPDDFMQPLYNRGRVTLPGGISWRSVSANPFTTHAELISNVASADLGAIFGGISRDISPVPPFFGQAVVQKLTGRNAFGRPFTAPPGYGEAPQQFGFGRQKINPATGLPEESPATPPFWELALQSIPLVPQLVRGVASLGQTPYDTESTFDIVTRRQPDWQLFQPPRDGQRATEPLTPQFGPVRVPVNPFLSVIGLNMHRRNPAVERQQYEERLDRYRQAQESERGASNARRRPSAARACEPGILSEG